MHGLAVTTRYSRPGCGLEHVACTVEQVVLGSQKAARGHIVLCSLHPDKVSTDMVVVVAIEESIPPVQPGCARRQECSGLRGAPVGLVQK